MECLRRGRSTELPNLIGPTKFVGPNLVYMLKEGNYLPISTWD
jgi:hypothetical protein